MSRITNVFMGASIAAFASAGLALGLASTASADPIPGPRTRPTLPPSWARPHRASVTHLLLPQRLPHRPRLPCLRSLRPLPPFRAPLRPPPRSRRLRVRLRLSLACLRPPPRA